MSTAPHDAAAIAQALGSKRAGEVWFAHCPAHSDEHPRLLIRDGEGGRVSVRCLAGCP